MAYTHIYIYIYFFFFALYEADVGIFFLKLYISLMRGSVLTLCKAHTGILFLRPQRMCALAQDHERIYRRRLLPLSLDDMAILGPEKGSLYKPYTALSWQI